MLERVEQWLSQMTLEEKAAYVAGADMWKTPAIPRLGIESLYMYDGTNGIRKPGSTDELGIFGDNAPAICYPTGSALGSSWNTDLLEEIGRALGAEGKHMDVDLLLGPGINMKRSPLAGRNFEYYSEDPCLSGELGAAFIGGLQSEGVGASLKHYACNNQETEKMVMSSEVDERTLREIYLSAFERIVRKADPWTVMCSYNLINGEYASENDHLLREILREEWGYDGVVISDWTAVYDRVKALKAGLDLEMPGPARYHAARLVTAVESGELEEETLNRSVRRLLVLHERVKAGKRDEQAQQDPEAYHALARRAAAECIVLLKNERKVLPLDKTKIASLAVIGALARTPRYQGGGSARVTPSKLEIPYDEIVRAAGDRIQVTYSPGCRDADSPDDGLIEESVAAAREAGAAVLFVGHPEGTESEGFDSKAIDLPPQQVRMIQAVAAVQPNCIVVLSNGSAVAMSSWIDSVPAVLEMWLAGQAAGGAIADLLFGDLNPSGKLSETFPVKLSDNPSYLSFGGEQGKAVYAEGLFVGYRYYDKKELAPQFPFGHGLSYTEFVYDDLRVSGDVTGVTVRCRIRNAGDREGREVVQLYVRDEQCRRIRPVKELKGFRKIGLKPGEMADIEFKLEERDFSYYDPELGQWTADAGMFEIQVGSSSRDIRLTGRLQLDFPPVAPAAFHLYSLLRDWLSNPHAAEVLAEALGDMGKHVPEPILLDDPGFIGFFGDAPLVKLFQMYGQNWLAGESPEDRIRQLLSIYAHRSAGTVTGNE